MKIVILDGYTANPGDYSWKELKSYTNAWCNCGETRRNRPPQYGFPEYLPQNAYCITGNNGNRHSTCWLQNASKINISTTYHPKIKFKT